jgi:2-polyprenyl-3-methyl-5-hydroxy-6-metoxy-1,4-benzoquinol methylase
MEEEQEWIESPDGWGENEKEEQQDEEEGGGFDLFADKNPRDYFDFPIKVDGATTKTLHLTGFKLDSDETAQSTGVTLWQAAPRLANYLQETPELVAGLRVMEVGAGLGLCGIVADHLGAQQVIMTDGDTKTLEQMRENVQENGATVDCRQLIWGFPHMEAFEKTHGKFDTILGADVIYTKASTDPLFDTVACLLQKPQGRFVLSRYNKWNNVSDETVLEPAVARNLHCKRPAEGIFIFHWKEDKEDDRTG